MSVSNLYVWHIDFFKYLFTFGYMKSKKTRYRIAKRYNIKYNKHVREISFWKFTLIFTWSRIV